MIVDATAGGMLMSKTVEKAHILLEEMVANYYQWLDECSESRWAAGALEMDQLIALLAQISTLSNQFASFASQGGKLAMDIVVVTSSLMNNSGEDIEQANYLNNKNFNYKGNPLPNYLSSRNNENLSYGN